MLINSLFWKVSIK